MACHRGAYLAFACLGGLRLACCGEPAECGDAAACPSEAAAEALEESEAAALKVQLLQAQGSGRRAQRADALAPIDNLGKDCLIACGGAGMCEDYCGASNACCRTVPLCGLQVGQEVTWNSTTNHTVACQANAPSGFDVGICRGDGQDGHSHWEFCEEQPKTKCDGRLWFVHCMGIPESSVDEETPNECQGVAFWPAMGFHTCVKPRYALKAYKRWCGENPLSDNWKTGEDVGTFAECQAMCSSHASCKLMCFGYDTSKHRNRCATFDYCDEFEYINGEVSIYTKNFVS